ncbi:hypothetical protein D3C81_1976310 [compost metagenome]
MRHQHSTHTFQQRMFRTRLLLHRVRQRIHQAVADKYPQEGPYQRRCYFQADQCNGAINRLHGNNDAKYRGANTESRHSFSRTL